MFARPALAALALLASAFDARASDALRCGSRIIAVEAHAADILAACGEPSFRDVLSYPAPGNGELADSEQWTYNFGHNQLLQVLRLRNGRLVDIRSDGYGFITGGSRGCSSEEIVEGQSKYRLVSSCGEPMTRRTVGYVNALRPRYERRYGGVTTSRGHYPVEVFREEWVYNFGSNRFLKVVTLEDGVVAEVQNGERGFNTR